MNEAVAEEILAEIAETETIRNTAARTAKRTIILLKAAAFSKDSKAEAEASIERRTRKYSPSTAENLAIQEPNVTVTNVVSKP